jgi:hypothetical protein
MKLRLRPGAMADAKEYGRIQYEAFKSIAERHNFPPDFPSVGVATDLVRMLLSRLASGLRVVAQATLMTIGLYNEPAGAYLPSILY